MKMISIILSIVLGISAAGNLNRVGGARPVTQDEEQWKQIEIYVKILMDGDHGIKAQLEQNASIDEMCSYSLQSALEQVVNGMNYWVKIDLCDRSAHVYFYVPFGEDSTPKLEAIQFPKSASDPLTVFRGTSVNGNPFNVQG